MSEPPERTAVYRLYDGEANLLYVGIASDPKRRWRQHATESLWWRDVEEKRVEWHSTRSDAEAAEKQAIRTEGPSYNTSHTASVSGLKPGWRPPAPAPSVRTANELHSLRQRGLLFSLRSRSAKVSMPELLARNIRDSIAAGRFAVGAQIPTVSALAHEFGVSKPTVSRGLQRLIAEGVLEHRPGRGTFVTRKPA